MLFARAQLTQILNGTVRGPDLRRELRRARAYARRVTAAARDDKDPRAYPMSSYSYLIVPKTTACRG